MPIIPGRANQPPALRTSTSPSCGRSSKSIAEASVSFRTATNILSSGPDQANAAASDDQDIWVRHLRQKSDDRELSPGTKIERIGIFDMEDTARPVDRHLRRCVNEKQTLNASAATPPSASARAPNP